MKTVGEFDVSVPEGASSCSRSRRRGDDDACVMWSNGVWPRPATTTRAGEDVVTTAA